MCTRYRLPTLFFHCYAAHRDLHSFPTRRSSDLIFGGNLSAKTERTIIMPNGILNDGYILGTANNQQVVQGDRKSTRLNSSHRCISYAVFCLKKKKKNEKKKINRKY